MKKLISILLLLLIVVVLTNCAKKSIYTCGQMALYGRLPSLESRLINDEIVGYTDTLPAFVLGRILIKTISETNQLIIEPAIYSQITFTESNSQNHVAGTATDINGYYKIYLKPNKYHVEIMNFEANTLGIDDYILNKGEIRKLDVALGQGSFSGGSSSFLKCNCFKITCLNPIDIVSSKEKVIKTQFLIESLGDTIKDIRISSSCCCEFSTLKKDMIIYPNHPDTITIISNLKGKKGFWKNTHSILTNKCGMNFYTGSWWIIDK
ncbi:MAG: hypothetical protein HXX18_02820 [Bacteroidetes bacterium]|nr:hypothetical protein [Bacteroidota bacterium]